MGFDLRIDMCGVPRYPVTPVAERGEAANAVSRGDGGSSKETLLGSYTGSTSLASSTAFCSYSPGVRAGGSQAPVVKSCCRTSSLSSPHLTAVSR